MSRARELVDVECVLLHETAKGEENAVGNCSVLDEAANPVWGGRIPFSIRSNRAIACGLGRHLGPESGEGTLLANAHRLENLQAPSLGDIPW